jgi:murein DD-endopeptidase MepM/ murein hydrolase activator NlpD
MIGRAAFSFSVLTASTGLAAVALLGSLTLGPLHRNSPYPMVPFQSAEPTVAAFAPVDEPEIVDDLSWTQTVGYMSYDYTHRLERGETLGGVLTTVGISSEEARAAVEAMRAKADPRRMRAGQELRITLGLSNAEGQPHEIQKIAFDVEFPYQIVVSRSAEGHFEAYKNERALDRTTVGAAGTIESSLFQAGSAAKVSAAVVNRMIQMFSWDVDFQRDIRRGDRFAVLFDQLADETGETVKAGDVSAAALVIGGKRLFVYRFDTGDGNDDYFTADGKSVRKPLLRTPVDGARLSSRYGNRRHPILGYNKMHKGVDFAAPTGTPIFASGDGTVEFVGRRGGYGNYIRVAHRSGYSTAYAHLSRFATSVKSGRQVKQGQIIGFVGSTGRSTGPHLHYEVLVNGRHIDPMSVRTLPGRTLAGGELKRFREFVSGIEPRLVALIDSETPVIVARADD